MKRINALHIVPALAVVTLWLIPQAHAQTPPPAPAAPVLNPVAPPTPAAAPKGPPASSQVTVTRSGGCVTVKVCPGTRCATNPAPAPVPAAPPAAPRANRPAPPQIVCIPAASLRPPMHRRQRQRQRQPLADPANTRLAVSNTAEVLGHGQWEFAARQIAGLFELSVGLGNRFQLSFKTAPVTWFIPGLKFKDSLWAGEIRAQIVRSPRFKLTVDATYFHVSSIHGLKLGLSAKIGTDKLALHVGVGAVLLFPPTMTADMCGGPTAREDGSYDYDCGGGGGYVDPAPVTILTANLGVEVRFWRYGKFFLDTFVAHIGDEGANMTLFALVPGVRFHGKGFAADLGLGVVGIGDFKIPLPVVNLSYRW